MAEAVAEESSISTDLAVVGAGAELTAPEREQLEVELEGIAVTLADKWRDRGQRFAEWLIADITDLQRVGDIQGALFPGDETHINILSFLTERCNYSPAMARFLILLRGVVAELPRDGGLPSLNPHMLDTLAKVPEQFLAAVLRKEEKYLGLTYDQMPITAKGSDKPSLVKMVKQLQDRVAYQDKPDERERERGSADSEDASMRAELEESAQQRLDLETDPEPRPTAPAAILGGATLFAHLRLAWQAWPTIQKGVLDDIYEGRVTKEDLIEGHNFALKLCKALRQYAEQA